MIKKYSHINNILKTGGKDMESGYVVAMLRVDGRSHNFVNGKKSKSKLARKRRAPVDVIENARQLGKGECVTLKSHDRVTVDIVGSSGPAHSGIYVGEHDINVYSDKVIIE